MLARGRLLSGADSSWWHMEQPTNPMIITAVIGVDAPLDEDWLRALLLRRLLALDRFGERVIDDPGVLGRPRWVAAESFDLDDHLATERLPEPGGQHALQALVSREMSRPLDPARPLWRLVHVPGYRGGSALVVRIHHCVADGLALIHLLLELDDRESNDVGAYWAAPAVQPPGVTGPAARTVGMALRTGTRVAGCLGRLAGMSADPASPLRVRLSGQKRAAWTAPLELAGLREAARRTGATLNDLLVSTVAGGVGLLLRENGGDVRRGIRAIMPVNLRREDEWSALGNRFGLVFAPLPVCTADPIERIRAVRRTMADLKQSPEAGVVFGLLELFGRTPRRALDAAVTFLGNKASLVFTNVPGPRRRIRFCGAEVVDLVAWVPASAALGLGISALSYADHLRFGVAADTNLMADPRLLTDAFERAAAQLLDRVPSICGRA